MPPIDSVGIVADDDLSIEGELLDENEQLEDADGPSLVLPDGIDQEEVLQELYKDLKRGEHAAQVLAEARMRKIIEFQSQFEHRTIEGLGQLACSVPLDVYTYWIAREGPDFWRERSNIEFIAHRAGGVGNPGFLARTAKKATVLVDRTLSRGCGEHGGEKPAGAAVISAPAALPSGVKGRRGRWAA